jgi:hypothetical protein
MNKIGVGVEIVLPQCGKVTSVTLKVFSILFACHSVILKHNYLLKRQLLNETNAA